MAPSELSIKHPVFAWMLMLALLVFGGIAYFSTEVIRPMAISVIGGVLTSTLLTLFVVPCAYSLFARLESHRHERDLQEAIEALKHTPKISDLDNLDFRWHLGPCRHLPRL